MYRPTRFLRAALLSLSLVASVAVHAAGYTLAPADATVNFISTKAGSVAEVHRFGRVSGSLGEDGAVRLLIDLASVDTSIEIRNDRMRDMLFEIDRFPRAVIEAQIDPGRWQDLAAGESVALQVPASLTLHGEQQPCAWW